MSSDKMSKSIINFGLCIFVPFAVNLNDYQTIKKGLRINAAKLRKFPRKKIGNP